MMNRIASQTLFIVFAIVLLVGLAATSACATTLANYDFSVLTGARNDWVLHQEASGLESTAFNGGVILDGTTEATVSSGVTLSNLGDGGPGSVNAGTWSGLGYATADSSVGTGPGLLKDGELNLAGFGGGTSHNENWLEFVLTAAADKEIRLTGLDISVWRNGAAVPRWHEFDVSTDGTNFSSFASPQPITTANPGTFHPLSFTGLIQAPRITVRYVPFPGSGNLHINALSATGTVILPGAGDFDDSGRVDQDDLDLVLLNWGQPAPPEWENHIPPGNVGNEELAQVRTNWGNTTSVITAAAVPEPSTLALLTLAALFQMLRTRCRPEPPTFFKS